MQAGRQEVTAVGTKTVGQAYMQAGRQAACSSGRSKSWFKTWILLVPTAYL